MDTISNPQNVIELLWTGGWDSTYRLVELSRRSVTVRPIYCLDPERPSTPVEQQAMSRILDALEKRPETKARILPVLSIDIASIPENPEITQAYRLLSQSGSLGDQYDWLARLSLEHPGLELGIEKANHEKTVGCRATILKNGALMDDGGVMVLDREHSTRECALVMGNFRFPIIQITEDEMAENIRAWGYEDIMAMIWFCHEPLRGECCGMCRPCQQKMEGRMEYLLPPAAQRRYRIYKKSEALFGEFPARVLAKLVYRPFL
ncbi:MAG: hypothetical protein ACI4PL_05755 [Faecousia sp.]